MHQYATLSRGDVAAFAYEFEELLVASFTEIAGISDMFSSRPYCMPPAKPLLGVITVVYQNVIERILVKAEQLLKDILDRKEEDALELTLHIKEGITFLLKNLNSIYGPFSTIFAKELESENYSSSQGFDTIFGVLTNCIQTTIDYSINAIESVAIMCIYNIIDTVFHSDLALQQLFSNNGGESEEDPNLQFIKAQCAISTTESQTYLLYEKASSVFARISSIGEEKISKIVDVVKETMLDKLIFSEANAKLHYALFIILKEHSLGGTFETDVKAKWPIGVDQSMDLLLYKLSRAEE